MKIEIGEYTLVAGGAESPEDQEVNAQALIQVSQAVRASAARVWHRGNLTFTHTFQITRQYASAGAAEAALFTHPAEVPTEGDITITVEPCDETAATITLENAAIHAFAARQIGRSIQWRYTITSGSVASTS